MSYCVEKGMPHSTFLEWSPEDRAKTLAYLYEQAERCTLCGTASWEWEENRFAYDVSEKFCRGCYIKAVSTDDRSALPGTTIELVPVTPQLRHQQAQQRAKQKRMQEEG
jgi:hypothetical protein